MAATLTETQLGKLSEGLQAATTDLQAARDAMVDRTAKVDALIKEQQGLGEKTQQNAKQLESIDEKLAALGGEMKTLAEQNTNLVHQTRNQMRTLGVATDTSNQAYVVTPSGHQVQGNQKGVIFESKQQALEIGMWAIATQHRETDARGRARKWIGDQGGGLRYLPNVPQSFIRDFGNEWAEQMKKIAQHVDDPSIKISQALKGGTTPGSVLVRPEFSNALVRNVEEYGAFRANALIWPMGSDTAWIPRRESGFTPYWEGEGEAGTASDPDFTLLGMTAKKILMLHQFSSEIQEDSAIPLAAILMQEFALAFATEEDRIGFNGTGTGGNSPGFAGFVGVIGAASHATAATADANGVPHEVVAETGDDTTPELTELTLRTMTGKLHTWARGNAKWYINRTVLADIAGISMGSAGGSVVAFRDAAPTTIMGYPVVEVEALPVSPSAADTHVLSLGDLRKSWILGDRHQHEVETSEHYAFNSDQITVRAKARIAFLMIQGNGMVTLQLAS